MTTVSTSSRPQMRAKSVAPAFEKSEDVPLVVDFCDGGPVSELSQAGVAATSGAAVAIDV